MPGFFSRELLNEIIHVVQVWKWSDEDYTNYKKCIRDENFQKALVCVTVVIAVTIPVLIGAAAVVNDYTTGKTSNGRNSSNT